MKLTKENLKKIIKEELEEMITAEAYTPDTIRDAVNSILSDFRSRQESMLRKEEVVGKLEFILKNYK